MLRNIILKLPDELISKANDYARKHKTTSTALIKEYLEQDAKK